MPLFFAGRISGIRIDGRNASQNRCGHIFFQSYELGYHMLLVNEECALERRHDARDQMPTEQIVDSRYIWRLHMIAYSYGSCGAVKRNVRPRFAHWATDQVLALARALFVDVV
jgi:hypothetical protein